MRGAALLLASLVLGCDGSRYEGQIRRAPLDTALPLDTGLIDEPDTDDPDTTDPDTDDPDTSVPPIDTEACYLGTNRAGTECVPTVVLSPVPAAYDYPPALNGLAQYREPERFLDLASVPSDTPIAPNFILSELASLSKGRWAVVQPHAVVSLQSVRDALGALRINSGYRSPDYNDGVGGASSSRHQYGDGFDIAPLAASLAEVDDECEAQGAGYVGVYVSHIHCDWRNDAVSSVFFGPSRRSVVASMHPELSALITWQAGVLTAPAQGWDEGEPLREWRAVGADGQTLSTSTSITFDPPVDAVAVDVVVGRRIQRRITL